jgi:hypothetical protein
MATGRLGTANITTTSDTTVYTVPATTFSVVSVNVVNRSSSASAQIKIAVASSATPGLAEYIEYDSALVANGVLERTGIVLKTGELIVVSTPTATPTLSVVVYGIETSTA